MGSLSLSCRGYNRPYFHATTQHNSNDLYPKSCQGLPGSSRNQFNPTDRGSSVLQSLGIELQKGTA